MSGEKPDGAIQNWTAMVRKFLPHAIYVSLAIALAVFVFVDGSVPSAKKANFAIVFSIGLAVGITELMERYPDAPFRPMLSIPGVFYFAINGGATVLAYYLIRQLDPPLPGDGTVKHIYQVLLGGFGAVAFFRSGFIVPINGEDVAVGPNLVLQIVFKALDRAYDRNRAQPRSDEVSRIMGGVSFASAKIALPMICFSLMQNITEEERETFGTKVAEIEASLDKDDEAKTLILGLSLMNLVGEETLACAVRVLGTTLIGFKTVAPDRMLKLAGIPAADVMGALPVICNELAYSSIRASDPIALVAPIVALSIDDDNKRVLVLYKLIARYGAATVDAAMDALVPAPSQAFAPIAYSSAVKP